MAIMGLTSQSGRFFCPDDQASDPRLHLAQALRNLPVGAPIVIMIHGFKYHPRDPSTDPHRLLYSVHPNDSSRASTSWPSELGFKEKSVEDGLAIGFGWEGRPSHKISPKPFLSSFSHVYSQAYRAGGHLARLLSWISELTPERTVDIIAHSLGARVAFCGIMRNHDDNLGRLILMGGAEYASVVNRCFENSDRHKNLEVFCVRSGKNAFVDFLFESFAPRTNSDDFAIGRGYQGPADKWLNIRLDHPATMTMLGARGIGLSRSPTRKLVDHWGFYQRAGIMRFYCQLLRNRPAWRLNDLRSETLNADLKTFEMGSASGLSTS